MRSIFLFLTLFVGGSAFAQDWNVQCDKFPGELRGGYCVHVPTVNPSGDIVYHLHGRGLSENTWQDQYFYTGQIRDYWKKHNLKRPTVVTLSFGPVWLLAAKNQSQYSGLLELTTRQIIPTIEQSLGGLKGKRIVFGESMGGFNSVQLALKTNMFQKAGMLCSPMAPVSPFDSKKTIRSYIETTSAWEYYKDHNPEAVLDSVNLMVQLTQAFFPTQALWDQANPMSLSKTSNSQSTKLYVAVGYYDKYANYEGNEMFVETLLKRGFDVEWRPQWGGHCAMDIPSLAEFLVQ